MEQALSAEGRDVRAPVAPWEALQGALRATALTLLAMGYVATVGLIVAYQDVPRWSLYAPPALLFGGGVAALALRLPYYMRAGLLLTFAFAGCFVANIVSPWPYVQLLYTLLAFLAGVLLGPPAATAIGVLGTAALLSVPGPSSSPGLVVASLAMLWLATALVWAAIGGLYLTVVRARTSEERAWLYAREANERRGELARAKKALSDMYGLLERTNYELVVARQEAEEARHIKAQFAANISHELRTPLNLILGFSEMMFRSPEVYGNVRWTPALSADIREIYGASRHLLGMIDDILDLSRIEAQRLPLRLEPADIGELVNEAVSTAAGLLRGKEVALETNLAQGLPALLADRTRIRQVLLNLLNNAIRFTDRGRIEVSAKVLSGEVVVAVTDTGVGIPPEEMAAIFEEFGQAKGAIVSGRGGAGLGLAICRQFVRLHGGQIEAESKVGQGSTFRFRLPLPESGRARSRLSYYAPEGWSPPVPENPLGKTAIVLGPDAEQVASLARSVQGYRALPADTLETLAEKVSEEHPAGIVLLADPLLPDAFAPEQVWQEAGRNDLPLIRCELPMEGSVKRELGVAEYLVKPVERERLLAAIRLACPSPDDILLVDDDAGFVALVDRILGADLPRARVRRAYSGEEALAALAQDNYDLVLLDLVMANVDGLAVIEALRREGRLAETPVIVTTGSGYADEVARLRPGRIELLRCGDSGKSSLGAYIKALLDVAPPDYSRH